MKPRIILLLAALICFASIQSVAQSPDETRVKILRTDQPGIIRLVYAKKINDHVAITFRTKRGNVSSDRIKGNNYPKGFSKRYDVREISSHEFWIEITSPEMTTIYHIIPSDKGEKFTAHLEKTIYNHVLIATK
ncbi:MAG TPA: hypothetical protein VD884_04090 [Ohtaekwangia sp.]|nr:hypothetical protein [Ohtaekwangia sp.]